MHETVQNLVNIKKSIKSKLLDFKQESRIPKIIAVSKTFKLEHIMPLIYYGHVDFGESKVQEAIDKWRDIKANNKSIKLHLIGKLQTNKVKLAVKFFDFIHSLDSEKLAKKIADEQEKQNLRPKIFIQINVGDEKQKSGIMKNNIKELQKASIIFISSIFKKNKNYLGINRFRNISKHSTKKIIALGGISQKNYKLLKLTNCYGFAGISYFKKKAPKKGPF